MFLLDFNKHLGPKSINYVVVDEGSLKLWMDVQSNESPLKTKGLLMHIFFKKKLVSQTLFCTGE